MKDTQLYTQILGITTPWRVESVAMDLPHERVTIQLSFDQTHRFLCPVCGKESSRYDLVRRDWRHLDTCQFETTIEAFVPRIECREHGIRQVSLSWAEPKSRHTILFESLVIRWLDEASVSAVARLMSLDWDTVHSIMKRAVDRGLSRREDLIPKDITIDETSEKKGHNYLTIVSDGSRVLYVAEGREQAAIDGFWATLATGAVNHIRSISVDLWKAYSSSVRQHVSNAEEILCLDRFHVAGYFGKALNEVRKQEHRELMQNSDDTLSGTKFDWLRSSGNIDNRGRRSFMEITRSALKTARAWAIKETARGLWHYLYCGAATKSWKQLFKWMKLSRLQPMIELAKSLSKHLKMILNAVRLKANSGCAESNNARIQK